MVGKRGGTADNAAVKSAQLVGLLLWRGGLLLIGAWALFEAARWFLRFVDLPLQLEIGLGLLIAGCALVVLSVILERIQDRRGEGDLSA